MAGYGGCGTMLDKFKEMFKVIRTNAVAETSA